VSAGWIEGWPMSSRPILRLPKKGLAAAVAASPVPEVSAPGPELEPRPSVDPGLPASNASNAGPELERVPPAVAAGRWLRTWPAFAQPRRPLQAGIHRELYARLPQGLTDADLRYAIKAWVESTAYWRAMTAPGAFRVDLQGQPVGPVSPRDVAHARRQLEAVAVAPGCPESGLPGPLGRDLDAGKGEVATSAPPCPVDAAGSPGGELELAEGEAWNSGRTAA